MKFSLPSFRKARPDTDAPVAADKSRAMPVAPGSPVLAKPVSLGKTRMQMLVAAVVLLVLLAVFVFQVMTVYITRAMDQEVRMAVDQVAARTATLVRFYSSNMKLLARDPDIARLLMAGDEAALQEREQSLTYLFPAAINVQLLTPGLEDVNMETSPPLGYATLAQMREAERSLKSPPAEVHLFNTPQQHINIVSPVMDPAGSGIVGHLVLSLSRDMLDELLGNLQYLDGYVELQQTGVKGDPVPFVSAGDASYRSGAPDAVQAISGSHWQAAFWSAQSSIVFLGMISLWVIGATGLLVVLMVLYTLRLFKRLAAGVQQDQVSLVTLMKDARSNQVKNGYPVGLAEMQDTMDFMVRLADNGQARTGNVVVDREQDEEYASEAGEDNIAEDIAPDFGALRTDNVLVEEDPLEIVKEHEENIAIDPSIFRAYDIRGVVNQTLTTHAVRQIGRAIGSEAIQRGRNTVVVGRDGRLSGPSLVEALVAGLNETGCDVKDIGCVPTPVLYFAAHYLDTQTGVVVTGSHNPPDYNGLKIVIDGETLSGEAIQQLRERIDEDKLISGQGSVETVNVIPDYIERVRSDVHVGRPLKVVIDCGNGVAGAVAPQLLRDIGCDVTELFCEVDGNFPNHHPDPSKAENLKDLIASVRENQADLGLAFDGDGDRLGVVTTEGSIVWPDRILMLFAADILDRNPGGQIIYDVKCTRFLDSIIREHGGEPLMWKTGHSFIKAKIKETGALLAGEMSGHIFFKERWYGFDDGLYSAARLLEVLGKDERAPTEVFDSLPDSVNTPELNVTMQEGQPPKYIDQLLASAHFDGARISTIDGLRADFDDGWGLVRASNTTPVLVLRFEADNETALSRIMEEFRRVMLQVDPGLSLPF
ncbi:MAG: phosphomannomutase/phosphoglucomutase [Pseudomonadota bacterium]